MDLRYEKIRSYIVQRPSVKAGGFFYIDFQDTKDTTATFKNQFILFLKGAPGIKQSGLRKTALRSRQSILWIFSTVQSRFFRLWSSRLAAVFAYGAALTCSKVTATTTPVRMLMCGKVTHMTLDSSSLFLYLTTGCILGKFSRISTVIKESQQH